VSFERFSVIRTEFGHVLVNLVPLGLLLVRDSLRVMYSYTM